MRKNLKLSEQKKKHANDQKLVHSGNELGRMKELLEEKKKSNVRHLESVKFHIEKENVEITQKKNTGLIEKLNQLNQEEKREEK